MTAAGTIKALASAPWLPRAAGRETVRDAFGLPSSDPGIDRVVEAITRWLLRAQAKSQSADGGVAAYYSLKTGWSSSYPETTGYIVPTLLNTRRAENADAIRAAVKRMIDWLTSIQFEDGSFQGGSIDAKPCVPVVFNTGQILFALAAGVREFGNEYLHSMNAAASWLVKVQDSDGAWRQFRSPFTSPGPKAYETHVAWALLEAEAINPDAGYADAALRHIRWALSRQQENGWFDDCDLGDPRYPLTHTIGYALRGVIEGWRHSGDRALLGGAIKCADSLANAVTSEGFLAGRLDSNWNDACDWACLTGSSQIAHCLIMLSEDAGKEGYLTAARALNRYVRRTIHIEGDENVVGGVKGCFPTYGEYGPHRFLNWAAKFTIDSNLAEAEA